MYDGGSDVAEAKPRSKLTIFLFDPIYSKINREIPYFMAHNLQTSLLSTVIFILGYMNLT